MSIDYKTEIERMKRELDVTVVAHFYQRDEVFERNKKEESKIILPLNEMEKEAIINALDKTRGSKRKAAKMLNISERTLYRKIKEYNIQ